LTCDFVVVCWSAARWDVHPVPGRLGELARYGMTADAWLVRRHPDDRRMATLLATVRHLRVSLRLGYSHQG
jgi:hypothetical protein